jgi:hypothetical protein
MPQSAYDLGHTASRISPSCLPSYRQRPHAADRATYHEGPCFEKTGPNTDRPGLVVSRYFSQHVHIPQRIHSHQAFT